MWPVFSPVSVGGTTYFVSVHEKSKERLSWVRRRARLSYLEANPLPQPPSRASAQSSGFHKLFKNVSGGAAPAPAPAVPAPASISATQAAEFANVAGAKRTRGSSLVPTSAVLSADAGFVAANCGSDELEDEHGSEDEDEASPSTAVAAPLTRQARPVVERVQRVLSVAAYQLDSYAYEYDR